MLNYYTIKTVKFTFVLLHVIIQWSVVYIQYAILLVGKLKKRREKKNSIVYKIHVKIESKWRKIYKYQTKNYTPHILKFMQK